jgi:hypothetical protein
MTFQNFRHPVFMKPDVDHPTNPSAAEQFHQPSIRSELGPPFQRFLPCLKRFPEFFVAHVRIPKVREDFARKILTQTAMFKMLLNGPAVMDWADRGRHLRGPERFSGNISATLALFTEKRAASAIDPANRYMVFIGHFVSSL